MGRIKIICDCGNEMDFIVDGIDEEDKGEYVKINHSKFRFWEIHDEIGVVCEKCLKSIWFFC
ncbi:MAG TPA: hypothetical protein GXX72_03250 [Clostridiaceae bacterium]|nr:hypothetical protein [Clostridiaceae bacterium]